jgi:hypothetical protein
MATAVQTQFQPITVSDYAPTPRKKLCAYQKRGKHFFITGHGYAGCFCSRECARKDEKDRPE